MDEYQLSMQNTSLFHTFKQHATFEIFSRTWHPLLPFLARLSKSWREEMQKYWREKLTAIERRDIFLNYWPKTNFNNIGDYRRLYHEDNFCSYYNGTCSESEILCAIKTCFLYNWPNAAIIFAKYCNLHENKEWEQTNEDFILKKIDTIALEYAFK